jgi:hypothetical protein
VACSREGIYVRDDNVANYSLLALPASLRTLSDGKRHTERDRMLTEPPLVESLDVGFRLEVRKWERTTVRGVDGRDGGSMVVEDVTSVLRGELCAKEGELDVLQRGEREEERTLEADYPNLGAPNPHLALAILGLANPHFHPPLEGPSFNNQRAFEHQIELDARFARVLPLFEDDGGRSHSRGMRRSAR